MTKLAIKSFRLSRQILLSLTGSLILALSAQLSIPLQPVPVTFQTMALLALAVFLGPELAFFAALTYLAEGAAGVPVFAGFRGGVEVLLGPTGGYLLAWPVAGYLAGCIAAQRRFMRICFAGIVSSTITLLSGTLFLSTFIGWPGAIKFGLTPFILIEIVKILAVAIGVFSSSKIARKST